MTTKRQVMLVAAVLIALGAVVITLAQINRSDASVSAGSIAITRDGVTLRTLTMDEVKALRSVSETKKIMSSSHADEEGVFTGVPLRVLLADVDPALLDEASMVVTRAADGYVSSLAVEEVSEDDSVLLAYAKDGEGLGTEDGGGTGPFRIVILTDTYGNRCTKWVNEIEIR